MTIKAFPGTTANGANAKGAALSGATTGSKLQYTCPAGFAGQLRGVTVQPTAGAATIQITARLSGTTVILAQATIAIAFAVTVNLAAGDLVSVVVSVLD